MVPYCSLSPQVCYRVEWAKFQERERKKEEEEKEKERVAYAQIDWHDFVVVETVDFQPNEQGTSARSDSKWERDGKIAQGHFRGATESHRGRCLGLVPLCWEALLHHSF